MQTSECYFPLPNGKHIKIDATKVDEFCGILVPKGWIATKYGPNDAGNYGCRNLKGNVIVSVIGGVITMIHCFNGPLQGLYHWDNNGEPICESGTWVKYFVAGINKEGNFFIVPNPAHPNLLSHLDKESWIADFKSRWPTAEHMLQALFEKET